MPVIVSAVAPFGVEMYEGITERVMPDGQLPVGCKAHIASPVDQGWRVITVWENREDFDRFREEKLLPAIRELSGSNPPAVEPEVNDVHRFITA